MPPTFSSLAAEIGSASLLGHLVLSCVYSGYGYEERTHVELWSAAGETETAIPQYSGSRPNTGPVLIDEREFRWEGANGYPNICLQELDEPDEIFLRQQLAIALNDQSSYQHTETGDPACHFPLEKLSYAIQRWLSVQSTSEKILLGLPRRVGNDPSGVISSVQRIILNEQDGQNLRNSMLRGTPSIHSISQQNNSESVPTSENSDGASTLASQPPRRQTQHTGSRGTTIPERSVDSDDGEEKEDLEESSDNLMFRFEESKESQLRGLVPQTSEVVGIFPARTLVPGENMPFDMVTGRQTTAPRRTGRIVEPTVNIHANFAGERSAQSSTRETEPQVASPQNSRDIPVTASNQRNFTQKNARSSRRKSRKRSRSSHFGDQRTSDQTTPLFSASNPNLDNNHTHFHIETLNAYNEPLSSLGTETPSAQPFEFSNNIAMGNTQSTNLIPDTHPLRESVSNFFHTSNPLSENALRDVFSLSSNPQFPADGLDSLFLNDMGAQNSFQNLGQDPGFDPNNVDLLENQNSQHSQFSSQPYNEVESRPPGLVTSSTGPESDHLSTGLDYVQPQSLSTLCSPGKEFSSLGREAGCEWWKQFLEDL